MNGASITLDENQLSQFKKVLNGLGETALKSEFWASLGAVAESQIRNNLINLKQDPETGAKWARLDEDYAARKAQTSSGGILEREGSLIDSITFDESNTGVDIGTNLIYAATHQFGRGAIVARRYIGLTSIDEMQQTVLTWYGDVTGG